MALKKVLLLSHDATMTGAPFLLLNLADVMLRNGYTVDFILKFGGPLEADFTKRGKTFLAHCTPVTIRQKLLNKLNRFTYFQLGNIDFEKYDAIISNTITNGDILSYIREKYSGTVISYIHELKMATDSFTTPGLVKVLIDATTKFAVPSEVVKDHLINNLAIKPQLINRLNYFIPDKCNGRELIKKDKTQFVVGALGVIEWRKSPDLFIQTAIMLHRSYPGRKIKFIWQGNPSDNITLSRLYYDIDKSGFSDKIEFIQASPDVNTFYNLVDVFFLTSREDPFPLVVLEAASYNIPTICFDGSGGACEFINASKGGSVIPYLELQQAVEKIIWYHDNQDALVHDGKNAKKHMSMFYQDENIILDQFEMIMQS